MDYEDLYRTLSEKEKTLKDTVNAVLRLQKLIVKDTESGNLAELNKSIALLNDAANAIRVCAGEMENAAAAPPSTSLTSSAVPRMPPTKEIRLSVLGSMIPRTRFSVVFCR